MDFVYAPPPPPPSSKKPSSGSAGSQKNKLHSNSNGNINNNNHNHNKKRNRNNHRKNTGQHKHQNNRNNQHTNSTTTEPDHEDSQLLFDLPTHLPNEVVQEPSVNDDLDLQEPNLNIPNQDDAQVSHVDNDAEDEDAGDELSVKPNDPSQPVFIPGTSITLQTDEDIAKWIEERKKKWPTRSNVLRKQQEKELQDHQQEDLSSKKRRNSMDSSVDASPAKKPRNICRFYQQHKHCKFGNKCKNIHESPTSASNNSASKVINPIVNTPDIESTHYKRTINDIPVLIPKLYSNNQKSGGRLFKHLVKREHAQHENTIVLDFVQYLDDKGLIDHDVMKQK